MAPLCCNSGEVWLLQHPGRGFCHQMEPRQQRHCAQHATSTLSKQKRMLLVQSRCTYGQRQLPVCAASSAEYALKQIHEIQHGYWNRTGRLLTAQGSLSRSSKTSVQLDTFTALQVQSAVYQLHQHLTHCRCINAQLCCVAPADGDNIIDVRVTMSQGTTCAVNFCLQVRPGDFLSRIASRAGINIEQLLLDNVERLDRLDAPVVGKQLLICNPRFNRALAPLGGEQMVSCAMDETMLLLAAVQCTMRRPDASCAISSGTR
jgi:LysM repeat protein